MFKVTLSGAVENIQQRSGVSARKLAGKYVKNLGYGIYPVEGYDTQISITFGNREYTFDPSPLIDFSKSKHIVITDINDGEGEVVEIVSAKSWQITIRGLLVDQENRQHPRNQIEDLCKIFELNESFEVSGGIFEEKNISHLLFIGIEFPGIEGMPDTQPFTITARSITAPEISLINTL